MQWLLLIFLVLVVIFASAILFGAPFLPTLKEQTILAVDFLDLTAGQTLLELGSGDGRVLRQAAKRGVRGIGYEINPLLVFYSRVVNWRYRKLITFHCRNFWHVTLPSADGIYVFLLQPYMQKLDQKIERECEKPIKVVSFAFAFPTRTPVKQQKGLMLYKLGASK
jgi:SAM-dependent methyltransferase